MEPIITSLMDNDLYKYSMQAVVHRLFPATQVVYEFRCRTNGVDLRGLKSELWQQIQHLCGLKFKVYELGYLASIGRNLPGEEPFFTSDYLYRLQNFSLPLSSVDIYTNDSQLCLRIQGSWFDTILFEVPLLAIINELAFQGELNTEGEKRFTEKIELVRSQRRAGGFQFSDFGTRRRYSRVWHDHVVDRLASELPRSQFVGTSNLRWAEKYGLQPIGTMAHEYLQAFQALAPLHLSQKQALETWLLQYRGRLGIALTDVVGIDAFLRDFDYLLAKAYDGVRHDSGDPITWTDKVLAHYKRLGINPNEKTLVYSDGLDIPKALDICQHVACRAKTHFGIGTNLTNDVGPDPLSIVIKMTYCNGQPVAKLSDEPGKALCPDEAYVANLKRMFFWGRDAI
jgi:nicotinate phosphoribosyltransferase